MSHDGPRGALHNLCLADPLWNERYEGWVELGHGGSASVVRTLSRALGEELALKVFPHLEADDWRRFQEEVRNAQRLTSPYIVRTYSPFPRGRFAWIEQELIDGPNLRQELERRARDGAPFSPAESLEIGAAVSTALAAAHEAGIVHRDVKPANILLPRSGAPAAKLGDFGISRLTGAARLTRTGLMAGTPQFAAPEVIAGGLGGPPADVYGLCECLYLVLSNNRFPFDVSDEATPTQWMRAHTDQKPKPIRTYNPAAPRELEGLLARGLAKEPERRPTAREMLSALDRLRQPAHLTARAPAQAPPRRVALVAAAVVAAAALGWTARGRFLEGGAPPRPAPSASPARLAEASPRAVPAPAAAAAASEPPSPAPAGPSPGESAAPEGLRVSVTDGLVTVLNTRRQAVRGVSVTLVDPAGARYTARSSASLGPGRDLYLAFEEFTPVPPADLQAPRVEVAEGGSLP